MNRYGFRLPILSAKILRGIWNSSVPVQADTEKRPKAGATVHHRPALECV